MSESALVSSLASLDGVTRRFGSTVALNELSLEVVEGSVCGLLGPNGSGKTTAIRVLLGLSRANAGRASLLGVETGASGFHEAVKMSGALIEGPALYGRASARQNMEIQAAARGIHNPKPEIERLLEMVGLSARAETNAKNFSMGMKQRLGLAIALVGSPRLVILDEPTNGLDPAGIVEIRELIKRLPESGVSVLVSSHLLAEVQLMCDRATIINRGSLVADGTMDEILGQAGIEGAYRVRVAPQEAAPAISTLGGIGLDVADLGSGELSVSGPIEDGSQISCVLAGSGIYLSELRRDNPDLESVFMTLTGGPDTEGGMSDAG
ncbi:MAG TPA: ATP-binding cassette domain-containing protein [Solirubrobacterales bacterium]|nr:ATP-binding cassette domain-containing protein [Solirubrobacterales bacterium]